MNQIIQLNATLTYRRFLPRTFVVFFTRKGSLYSWAEKLYKGWNVVTQSRSENCIWLVARWTLSGTSQNQVICSSGRPYYPAITLVIFSRPQGSLSRLPTVRYFGRANRISISRNRRWTSNVRFIFKTLYTMRSSLQLFRFSTWNECCFIQSKWVPNESTEVGIIY